VAKALGGFCSNPTWQWFFDWYYAHQLIISHSICLIAFVFFVYACFGGARPANSDELRKISVILVALFVTSASYYALAGMVATVEIRYSIGGGDLELHLMFLIAMFTGVRILAHLSRRFFSLPNANRAEVV
jgi:hypothetical protein